MQNERWKDKRLSTQLPKNLAGNLAYFVVNIIIGLLLVPYFISTLGVAAYGLIPLATSITGYVAIAVQSLNSSVGRYLTIDLQQNNFESANKTFNTAILGLSAIIILLIPVVVLISVSIPHLFNVPADQETGAIYLFLGVCIAFLLRLWSGNFTVQLFAYNRLDLLKIVNISNVVVQTVLILIFFTIFGPNIALVGVAYLGGSIFAGILSIIFAKRICPELFLSLHDFDRFKLSPLCKTGGWVLINQIGSLLFLQIDLIVVNILFGSASAGEYAVALQWVVLLRALSSVLGGILTPIVYIYYAKGEISNLIHASKSAVKLMGLAMALPIGLICAFAPNLLLFWVGENFTSLAPLMIVLTLPLAINLSITPLFSINMALKKNEIPAIVTLIMGVMNIILALKLPMITGWGYYGVAAAGAIVLTLKNALFTPWYATKILGINRHTFTYSMVPGVIGSVLIFLIGLLINKYYTINTIFGLFLIGIVIGVLYMIIVWKFLLSESELRLFNSYLTRKGWG